MLRQTHYPTYIMFPSELLFSVFYRLFFEPDKVITKIYNYTIDIQRKSRREYRTAEKQTQTMLEISI